MADGPTLAVVLEATNSRATVRNGGEAGLEEFLEIKAAFGYAASGT